MGRVTVAALVCWFLVGSAAWADKEKARESYKRGMSAFLLNQFDDAIHEFEVGFRQEPEPAFLYNIAQAHLKAGRKEKALEFYLKYLEMIPEDAPDRADVKRRVEELERVERTTTTTPTTTTPTSPSVAQPVVSVAVTTGRTPAPTARRRPWVWGIVGVVAGVVVVGGAVGIGVGVSTPVDAAAHPGTEPSLQVSFR